MLFMQRHITTSAVRVQRYSSIILHAAELSENRCALRSTGSDSAPLEELLSFV